jgi:mono/diheme cytochrome c family protein
MLMPVTASIVRVSALLGAFLFGTVSFAVPPRIAGYERFHAEQPDAAAGWLLVRELNCVACHAAEKELSASSKPAPILTDIGERARPEWLRQFLRDPLATKPGSTMPHLLGHLSESERNAQTEALVHFLVANGRVSDVLPDAGAAKRGMATFQRVGCAACHNPLVDNAPDLATSIPLPDLQRKYTATSLAAFLKDPLKVRPGGRMPALGLKDDEYRDIAHYFLKDIPFEPNVRYAAYHGRWDTLPDFSLFEPKFTGECGGFDLNVAKRTDNFAIRFETSFVVKQPGQHQFWLGSDDGSRLLIDCQEVVNVDGVHPHHEQMGKANLDVGVRQVVVEYFQGGGEWTLSLDVSGPGLKRQPLAGLATLKPDATETARTAFEVDPQLAEKGRDLFVTQGCASCHEFKLNDQALRAETKSIPLKDCDTSRGCLAANPGKSPNFDLSDAQRKAIVAALSSGPRTLTAEQTAHETLVTFNCYACHQRGEIGGVEAERNAFFETKIPEMGDEGRLAPSLTGVGDKLQAEWLKQLFNRGANDRQNYMQARMPRYGLKNVGHLVETFAAIDQKPDEFPPPEFPEPDYRIKAHGRQLVGAQALSCIKCHDFAEHPAQGIRAINLTTMTQRLRPDWLHRYLLNPQAYRPGTRMPSPWPFGQTTIKKVLGANVGLQIEAVALYLRDGDKAAIPVGLVREPIELVPDTKPVIYRNFIEGASARGIGVGYPGGVNIAWDANTMRLAMIWHGAFIDASRHWTGRGVGFEGPLGDHVLPLANGAPLATLPSLVDSWPANTPGEIGYRFLGYRLDPAGNPTFRYRWGETTVEDTILPEPIEGQQFPGLSRELKVSGSPPENAWFRAAVAKTIEPQGEGRYLIDGYWTLTVESTSEPTVRPSGEAKELLIPLGAGSSSQSVRLSYRW